MKHDDIMCSLDDYTLNSLLKGYFEYNGPYGPFNSVGLYGDEELINISKKNYEELDENDFTSLNNLVEKLKHWVGYSYYEDKSCAYKTFEKLVNLRKNIEEDISNGLYLCIEKNFEHLLINTRGKDVFTKGFIDLIVHVKPQGIALPWPFRSTPNLEFTEFIIEIKKESDFQDIGNILRQIKEYRYYYNMKMNRWSSYITKEWNEEDKKMRLLGKCRNGIPFWTHYCILSTKIPEKAKHVFKNEKIDCLELDSLNTQT